MSRAQEKHGSSAWRETFVGKSFPSTRLDAIRRRSELERASWRVSPPRLTSRGEGSEDNHMAAVAAAVAAASAATAVVGGGQIVTAASSARHEFSDGSAARRVVSPCFALGVHLASVRFFFVLSLSFSFFFSL